MEEGGTELDTKGWGVLKRKERNIPVRRGIGSSVDQCVTCVLHTFELFHDVRNWT